MYLEKDIQASVLSLLGWNEERHNQYVHDTALSYLHDFIPNYPQVIRQITQSSIFWRWWCQHWTNRDKTFIEMAQDFPAEDLEDLYKEEHDYRTLSEAVYMNGQVLEETYASMIGEVTRTQKKEVA